MRILILTVIVLTALGACGEKSWTENPEQLRFHMTFVSSESTDAQIEQLRSARSHPVENWNARVGNVYESGPFTIIKALYGSQEYRLFVFGDKGRAMARTLKKDAFLTFTGDLGPEQSATLVGARSNAEFEFYPTSVISAGIEIRQDAAQIATHEKADRIRDEEDRQKRQRAAIDSSIEEQVLKLCRQTVLEQLRYPASGSFSWFQKQVEKQSEEQWVYRDVITAKNSLGAELPNRFICSVQIEDGKMAASVNLLD